MTTKHIHFIINPASGKEEPILSFINRIFEDLDIAWDVTVTRKNTDVQALAKSLIGKTDIIAVYGGDGTLTEMAAALHGSDTPLAIIPGGTANVMAKELGIPLDTFQALIMLAGNNYTIRKIDMGVVNGRPFLLRLSIGIMADMVLQTDRKLKDDLGQLAYGVTALKLLSESVPIKYNIEIDGAQFEENGVSLTVTNSGNIGIGDFALQPGISINDGLLDVLLLRNSDLTSLLKVAGSTLLQSETNAVIHWKGKHIVINMEQEHVYICDDCEEKSVSLEINVSPESINIIVPTTE